MITVSQEAETIGPGGMVGVKVGEVNGSVTVVQGNVFHVRDPSPELLERLGATKRLSTEVQPGGGAAPPADPSAPDPRALERPLGEILTQVRAADRRGERVDTVAAGSLRFTRAELTLKEAVLLIAEADQIFLDQVRRDAARGGSVPGPPPSGLDLAAMLQGFDDEAHSAKLREALSLLREARALEPTNAEVLLHLAKVMDGVGQPPDEVRLVLYQVQRLLESPRSAADTFHLAQATFLLAMHGEMPHAEQVMVARGLFASIGRGEWVRQCDEVLGRLSGARASSGGGGYGAPGWFEPVGTWRAQLSDGSTARFALLPNGMLQGVQRVTAFGMEAGFAGQWGYDPASRTLQLQGMVNGFTPFVLVIEIQGASGGGFIGYGSDGMQYLLRRE